MIINSLLWGRKLNSFNALIHPLAARSKVTAGRERGSMEVVKVRQFAPLMMVASLSLLSACSSSNGTDAASEMGRKMKLTGGGSGGSTPTPTPTPTPTSITAVTYDTSIGNGVDVSGFADLPLRSGAKRFFVNSAAGSDGNSCSAAQSASAPKATLASATSCLTSGEGDQILIAQGTSYAAGLNNISGVGGYSPLYPTVIQSYDPADPTNEAKYGRATGSSRPVLNTGGAASQYFLMGSGTSGKYYAVRGLDFNPGSGVQLANITILPNTNGTPDYVLFENDIFRYTQLTFDSHQSGAVRTTKLIVRNSSFYNEYGDHSQGIYADNVDGTTIEDSVFYANGRIGGVSRDAPQSSGGASIFNHPIYMQDNTRNTLVRRNVFLDTATDGGNLKGGGTYTQNLVIRCANAFSFGGGNDYSVDSPNGVVIQGAYNAVIGSNIVNSTSGAVGWGIHTSNGMQGSSAIHHNVLAMNTQSTGYALMADTSPDITYGVALPNYTSFHDNVSYKWNPSGQSTQFSASSLLHATADYSIWDDPTSGTNRNIAGIVFPNAYTEASLLSALGYADETSFINDVINNPEKHVQRQGVALMLSGYGVDTSAMKW